MVKSALVFGEGKSTLLCQILMQMNDINNTNINENLQSYEQKTSVTYNNEEYKFYNIPSHFSINEVIKALYCNPLSTAVLIVSADKNEHINSGLLQECTILARCAGIKNLVVCIDELSWGNFSSIVENITNRLVHIGYKPIFVPISVEVGEGLLHRSKEFPNHPCLLEVIKEKINDNTDCKDDISIITKNIDIMVKLYSPCLISAGWKGICYLPNTSPEPFTVKKVFTVEGKEITIVNNKDCLLTIEFNTLINIIKNSRVIIRNGDKTIAGGFVNKN